MSIYCTQNIKPRTQSIKRPIKGDASFPILDLIISKFPFTGQSTNSFLWMSSLTYGQQLRQALPEPHSTTWTRQKINTQEGQGLLYRDKLSYRQPHIKSESYELPGYQNTAQYFIYILWKKAFHIRTFVGNDRTHSSKSQTILHAFQEIILH